MAAPVGVVTTTVTTYLPASAQKAVDVLFLIDNSPSMSPKQAALAAKFQSFINVLDASGASYHVGVVTSDVGAAIARMPFSMSLGPACDSATGDDGRLQSVTCDQRLAADFSSAGVQSLCGTVCPTPVAPFASPNVDGVPVTANFIASSGGSAPTTNVPGNAVAQAFACLAFVGDQGCGVENQLEAVRRALSAPNNQAGNANADFLRPGALLAIILITDEDDCSVADRTKNDPMSMDCSPGGSFTPNPFCFNPDYRCFAEGARCDQPLDQPGAKTHCKTTTGTYLYDVAQYTQFFDQLAARDGHTILVDGIVSPPGGPVVIDYEGGATTGPTPDLNRSVLQPACSGPVDPITGQTIVGKPQVRLDELIRHYNGNEYSVCATDQYDQALADVAKHITQNLPSTCIPPLPSYGASGAGTPADQCSVSENDPATHASTPVAECSSTCCDALAADPNGLTTDASVMAACQAEVAKPCWCAVKGQACSATASTPTLIGVYWGATPPQNASLTFACQTQ
jgi:hypothetical protein